MNPSLYIAPASDVGVKDIALILWRRKLTILVVLSLSLGAAYIWTRKTPQRFRAVAQMIVSDRSGIAGMGMGQDRSQTVPEGASTQVAMLESENMAQRTVNWLRNDAFNRGKTLEDMGIHDVAHLEENIASNLTVNIVKETNLIEVKVDSDTPQQCALLANAVCQAFVQWKKEVAQQGVQDTLTNLEVRARRAKDQMLEAERREMEFKRSHQMVDVNTQQSAALTQFLAHDAEVAGMKQDLIAQETKLKVLGQRLSATNKAIDTGTGVRDDALVLSLQQQLNTLEIDRASLRLKYTQEYPGMLPDLDAKIGDVKTRLTQAVQATLNNKMPSLQVQGALFEEYKQQQAQVLFANSKLSAGVALRDRLKQSLAGLPMTGMQYARLANNAALDRAQYASLQTSLNAVEFGKDMATSNVQVAAAALAPTKPFQPDLKRNLLTGGIAGAGFALLLAFLIDHADRRVRTSAEVRRILMEPIIGSLPSLSRSQMWRMRQGETPPLALEAYNMAWANLTMRHDVQTPMTLLVTSTVPGEGKSTTAAHLARTLARSGKRVILVDADLRRPMQNRLFHTAEEIGLANVLSGDSTLADALVSTEWDNLLLLHSGKASRNPTDLLSSPNMASVLREMRSQADVLLIDTSACSIVADALILSSQADAILYVVGGGKVDEDMLAGSVSMLNTASQNRVFLFVNGGPKERRHAYRKYYSCFASDGSTVPLVASAAAETETGVSEWTAPSDRKEQS